MHRITLILDFANKKAPVVHALSHGSLFILAILSCRVFSLQILYFFTGSNMTSVRNWMAIWICSSVRSWTAALGLGVMLNSTK